MARDSEKRFEAVMEKLFQEAPKSSNPRDPSSSRSSLSGAGAEFSRGKKRPLVSSASALVLSRGNPIGELQNSAGAVCRPWHRDDLFRRLATFKSMTWFAKPQAVSRVNCARRGWINIDTDTLSCESCGARLLFSTPSSWDQQQVEKAALVFSLKLDTGHKLLCPWVDNICDEKLADFPPKPTAVLQEEYKKRCSVLLHLTALPLISASAIDIMDSPELQQFLVGPPGVEQNMSTDASNYYQAQKLISLCGWEPHSLQYIVDCDIGKDTGNLAHPSHPAGDGLNLSVVTCPSDKNIEDYYNSQAPEGALFEPSSAALKCRLCGASVGLWAFSSVQRPIEFLRLVGFTSVNDTDGGKGPAEGLTTSTSSNLSLTIAGGPPPAKQNYRSTIYLPVVGRILRARLSTNSLVSDGQEMQMIELNTKDYEDNQIGAAINYVKDYQPEDVQVVGGGLTSDNELKENEESIKTGNTVVLELNRLQMGEASSSGLGETAMTESMISSETDGGTVSEAVVSKHSDREGDLRHGSGAGSRTLVVYGTGHSSLAKIPEQACEQKSMKFDPIRQHKALCPWITSNGNSLPGWKQTLTAILLQKEFSGDTLPEKAPSALIEVDDPVESIRQLFNTPPAKRMKHT